MFRNLFLTNFALLFICSILSVTINAKKVGKPKNGMVPPFLVNATNEAKKAVNDVHKNKNLTMAQMETEITALGQKFGFSAAYKESLDKKNAELAVIKTNTTTVLNNLQAVSAQLLPIQENKEQTHKAQLEAVAALRAQYPVEVDTLMFIQMRIGGSGGKKHDGKKGGGKHGGGKKGGHKGGLSANAGAQFHLGVKSR